ncbi:unnamed protein product [Discosporangium mesarthrocarpum]
MSTGGTKDQEGEGRLNAASNQALFALVYRGGQDVYATAAITPDEVMDAACQCLQGEGMGDEEIRLSGLKLLMGVAAAGLHKKQNANTTTLSPPPPPAQEASMPVRIRSLLCASPAWSQLQELLSLLGWEP